VDLGTGLAGSNGLPFSATQRPISVAIQPWRIAATNIEKNMEEYRVAPEGSNFGIESSVVRTFWKPMV